MRRPAPDFVIVGAPKCGTTALYSTLRRHPALALSRIKEPYYFASDYPRRREMDKDAEYEALFAHAREGQLRGEASAIYLSSGPAIPAILERRPDARFIAMVRDPVDMFVSWHNECLKSLDEDERDPVRAWALQNHRAAGRLPALCKEPGYLQYRKICSLGCQIDRLFDLVPANQRLVVVWDDLNRAPAAVYRRILRFLGVEDTGAVDFRRENGYAAHRSRFVALLARSIYTHESLKRFRLQVKPLLNGLGIYPLRWAVNYSLQRAVKPALPAAFLSDLRAEFRSDVLLLEQLIGRDLSDWRVPMERADSLASLRKA